MEVDQAQPLAHGFPGTPVEGLFPLGNLSARFGQETSVAIPQPQNWEINLHNYSEIHELSRRNMVEKVEVVVFTMKLMLNEFRAVLRPLLICLKCFQIIQFENMKHHYAHHEMNVRACSTT